jgi:hypothetical protein
MWTLRDAVNLHVARHKFHNTDAQTSEGNAADVSYVTELEGCGGWNN